MMFYFGLYFIFVSWGFSGFWGFFWFGFFPEYWTPKEAGKVFHVIYHQILRD